MTDQDRKHPDGDNSAWTRLPPSTEYLCIGSSGTTFADNLKEASEDFRTHFALHIHHPLDPVLLATIDKICGGFTPDPLRPGAPEVETPQRAGLLLDTVLKRPGFLRWLESVTGCGPLVSFEGRLTQSRPSSGERGWHDDLVENPLRRVALVINLSPAPYEGAPFQLIHKTGQRIFEHHYTEPNQALLFKVDPSLAHRVPPVTAGGPRRVYAGWGLAQA